MRRLLALLTTVMALALLTTIVACGGDDDDDTTPSATATTGTAAASPTTAAAAYPASVTDMAGKTVSIKQKPATVVAVSPTAAEFVYAAGGTILGRSSTVKFPTAAAAATDIGSAYNPSAEKILALKPDLIVGDSVIIKGAPNVQRALDGLGVPVVYVGAENYADVLAGLDLMGKVFNSKATTDEVKAQLEKAKNDAKAAVAAKKVTVVAITADEKQQLFAAKDSSYVGDIMKQLGLSNPAAGLPDTPPYPGYSLVAVEKMLELNPDYIFAITPDPRAPQLSGTLAQIPPFRGLKAITNKHVVDANLELFLQAPGPRIGEAFKAMAAALTAP